MSNGGENKWQLVIAQGSRIGVISGVGEESVIAAEQPKRAYSKRVTPDHREAILKLHIQGHAPQEIRDAMMAAGYFQGKSRKAAVCFIRAVLRPYGEPKKPRRIDLKVERLMALAQKTHRLKP